jgi:hypothetical protein
MMHDGGVLRIVSVVFFIVYLESFIMYHRCIYPRVNHGRPNIIREAVIRNGRVSRW